MLEAQVMNDLISKYGWMWIVKVTDWSLKKRKEEEEEHFWYCGMKKCNISHWKQIMTDCIGPQQNALYESGIKLCYEVYIHQNLDFFWVILLWKSMEKIYSQVVMQAACKPTWEYWRFNLYGAWQCLKISFDSQSLFHSDTTFIQIVKVRTAI